MDAGLRHRVELWANGGMKTGEDVVKMILLGANRVRVRVVALPAPEAVAVMMFKFVLLNVSVWPGGVAITDHW